MNREDILNRLRIYKESNKKRGKKFVDEYLVESIAENLTEPARIEIIWVFLTDIGMAHEI